MATFEASTSLASKDELTVVVPVHGPDHGRLQRLLLPSLVENLVGSYSTIVVSTDGAGDVLSELLVDAPVTVVSSGDVLPGLDRLRNRTTRARLRAVAAAFGGLRRLRVDVRYTPSYALRGWFQQQAVKLALAYMIETPFYLALDADMICVRRTHVNELLVDGRAPISFYERIPPSQEPWYRWAGDLLRSEPPTVAMAMPPFIFATEAVRSLINDLPTVAPRPRLMSAAHRFVYGSVDGSPDLLLSMLPWTEYSLYHTYVHDRGLISRHYQENRRPAMLGNALWSAREAESWSGRPSIEQLEPHVFTLVQPHAGFAIERLEREFRGVLPTDAPRRSDPTTP